MHPVCPCVPLCRAGGVVAGQGNLERICHDFGRREKEGAWSRYLQGRALPDAKNDCSPAIFVNILLIKNKFMKNEHQKKSHIGSLLIRYLMKCKDRLILFIITKNSIYDADHFFGNMPHCLHMTFSLRTFFEIVCMEHWINLSCWNTSHPKGSS